MNKRDYKNFSRKGIYHIYNRGNNKEKIFFDEQDYKAFLFRLGLCLGIEPRELNENKLFSLPYSRIRIENIAKNNFTLHSFCLMPNHFHFLIEQNGDVEISKLLTKLCTSYAKYLNNKYKRVGHVFQDKFKSVLVETNSQLMWTSAYIHMNPVKDKIVRSPENYLWSSYGSYTKNQNMPILHTDFLLETFGGKNNFKEQTLNFDVKDGL